MPPSRHDVITMGRAAVVPIDMVFTWVDGTDPAHLRERRRCEAHEDATIGPATRADGRLAGRFEQAGEIVASVNSVLRYLPWVRTVYVVTASQVPPVDRSLLRGGRLQIVDHADIVPAAYLPTFNSRVVESCLHRIPGLSDVFLYDNDDYFHFAPVAPSAFVDALDDGRFALHLHVRQTAVQRALHATEWLSPIGTRAGSLHAIGIYNAYARLRGPAHRLRAHDVLVPRHSTQVIRRSTAERLDAEFAGLLDADRRLRFRSARGHHYGTLLYTMEKYWHPEDRLHRALRLDRSTGFRMFDFRGASGTRRATRLWHGVARSQDAFACLNNLPPSAADRFRQVMARKGLLPDPGDRAPAAEDAGPAATEAPRKRFLMISPYFPPMSRIGAKRPLHLSRHLAAFGWAPVVLAAPPGDEHVDAGLLDQIPADIVVSRTYESGWRRRARGRGRATPSSFENGGTRRVARWPLVGGDTDVLSPLDRYAPDVPASVRHAVQLVRRHELQAIHVIGTPWTALLAGVLVHRVTGRPLIVDLRDPWALDDARMARRPRLTRAAIRALEGLVLRRASRIVLNTSSAAEAYRATYADRLPPERFTWVRNAFDPAMFNEGVSMPADRFRVLYYGRFHRHFTPEPLLEGFRRFLDRTGSVADDARLTFVGGLRPADHACLRALRLEEHAECPGFVPYRDALPHLRRAHALCLVVPPECGLQIPGKFYDYLAARRPILAITDNIEIRALLEQTGSGVAAAYGDAAAVADRLCESFDCFRRGASFDLAPEHAAAFTALEQARAFAQVLDEVTA